MSDCKVENSAIIHSQTAIEIEITGSEFDNIHNMEYIVNAYYDDQDKVSTLDFNDNLVRDENTEDEVDT